MWTLIWSWFTLPIPHLACKNEAGDVLLHRRHSGRALAQCLTDEPQSQVPTDYLYYTGYGKVLFKPSFLKSPLGHFLWAYSPLQTATA